MGREPLDLPYGLSSSSASTALAALGSGMLAVAGFVTSVVLLVDPFGSTQFSSGALSLDEVRASEQGP